MKKNLILPSNPRYQPKQMVPFFAYDNLYRKVAEVEIATLKTLHEIGIIPDEDFKCGFSQYVETQLLSITTTEVDKIEREITHHDIRAWIRRAQEIIGKPLVRWVHVPLTSYDPIDTGRMMQFRDAYEFGLQPSIKDIVVLLSNCAEKFAGKLQIGRTHGQHALPITVGFWFATILNRLLHNWKQMDYYANCLLGKISGAVGAHNAQYGLNFTNKYDKESFEDLVLKKLGLKPAPISTQILPPEPLAYFLFSCTMMSATIGQFGRDGRNLMRSEIAELSESFEKGQVGSSTMAHKRNPINFENLEGTWIKTKNEFGKVMDTLISEHQRDLVGSSVARDYPIILINLQHQLNTLSKRNKDNIPFLSRLNIDTEACKKNFEQNANFILAEPLYIALQMAGHEGDAHELVNRTLMPIAKEKNIELIAALELVADSDDIIKDVLSRMPENIRTLMRNPASYIGDAKEKALCIVEHAKQALKE
ncbi:MAG: lyase family protein [Patescibacteria group bacterium]|nr:lyase family protein [Patescibacteria group bacterium]